MRSFFYFAKYFGFRDEVLVRYNEFASGPESYIVGQNLTPRAEKTEIVLEKNLSRKPNRSELMYQMAFSGIDNIELIWSSDELDRCIRLLLTYYILSRMFSQVLCNFVISYLKRFFFLFGIENMRITRIFLASSNDTGCERRDSEISINRLNAKYYPSGIFLKLVLWEKFNDAVSKGGKQNEYN